MNTAPIIVSVYTRYEHFKNAIQALQANKYADESDLYIVSDAPAKEEHASQVADIREYIGTITGFKSLTPILREVNFGSTKSIKGAFEDVLKLHDRFIFLEDDIVTAPLFLQYMNDALDTYRNDPRIHAISSYALPIRIPFFYKNDVYLGKRFSPWGFGIWKERYEQVDLSEFDRFAIANKPENRQRFREIGDDILDILQADSEGRINALDARICYHQIMNQLYNIVPVRSLSLNNGLDGSGEHCGTTGRFYTELDMRTDYQLKMDTQLKISNTISRRFKNFENNFSYISLLKRPFRQVYRICKKAFRKLKSMNTSAIPSKSEREKRR